MGWGTVPLIPRTQQNFICCCRPCFYINLHAVCELTCSDDFRDTQGVLKLMVGAWGPLCTIYEVMIPVTVGLVHINLRSEYEFPSSTRFGRFRKYGKIGVGETALPSYP